jgi:hypothetical protein
MKKFIIILLALGLAGCAQLQAVGTGISLATKTIANPVTKAEEAQVELSGDVILQGLLAYKQACQTGTADKNCRANVAQVQAYTRQIRPLIAQLRTFVDNNDQINASVIYNQLTALYTNAKSAATALGINLGGVS